MRSCGETFEETGRFTFWRHWAHGENSLTQQVENARRLKIVAKDLYRSFQRFASEVKHHTVSSHWLHKPMKLKVMSCLLDLLTRFEIEMRGHANFLIQFPSRDVSIKITFLSYSMFFRNSRTVFAPIYFLFLGRQKSKWCFPVEIGRWCVTCQIGRDPIFLRSASKITLSLLSTICKAGDMSV